MEVYFLCLAFLSIIQMRFVAVDGSYLDVPRIHFAGKFRADVNTRNNWPCNFDYDQPINSDDDWNYKGTSEWELIDTHITSVIDADGNDIVTSPLVGAELFSNQVRPLAKIVDLDVDYQISTLYGLKLGLRVNNETWFVGEWSPSVIAHNLWFRMKCYTDDELKLHDAVLSGSSTSRITNIKWFLSDIHPDFQELTQCARCTGDLSVAISYNFYSQETFTIGEIIGTIGVAKAGEPLNDGGDRKLETSNANLTFPPEHKCAQNFSLDKQMPWTHIAPFIVEKTRSKLVVDISNAFPVDSTNKPIDLGTLWFGILKQDNQVIIIGDEVPYRNQDLIKTHGGIIEQHIDSVISSHLESLPLVIVKDTFENDSDTPFGSDSVHQVVEMFHSLQGEGHKVKLLFKEVLHYIRPIDHYVDRLEYNGKTSISSVTLLVSQFGIPASDVTVRMHNVYEVIPQKGVVAIQEAAKSNENGYVAFTFKVHEQIPEERHYRGEPCPGNSDSHQSMRQKYFSFHRQYASNKIVKLPIDGQVYPFYYCADTTSNNPCEVPLNSGDDTFKYLCPNILSFLAFSTMNYQKPYTWIDHVNPIFHQNHHLHYIMSSILNLKNYTEVTLPHNIELLRMSFTRNFMDPNYMPVTRDLSPTKQAMILEWLNKPCYDRKCSSTGGKIPEIPVCSGPNTKAYNFSVGIALPSVSYFRPPRCERKFISYKDNPDMDDSFFHAIIYDKDLSVTHSHQTLRPLFGFHVGNDPSGIKNYVEKHFIPPNCSLTQLRKQLQIATELEFATLPLYLTSLYSIVQDCNVEAYELMRGIVMQEMLHYAQAANVLISVGGNVVLDTPQTVPKYPRKGLPGGVLPHLYLTLHKFTLEHVYYTFMGIETPTVTLHSEKSPHYTLNTIGQFYREIEICMSYLGDEIFEGNENKQIKWPWKMEENVGKLYTVTDLKSAKKAIKEIIDQGEGSSPLNPESGIHGQFAHFYSFEEIVCQKRLEKSENGYAYSGPPIPYDAKGVWPMRDNPRKACLQENTECHTEARAFHQVYRNFLRVLQETVDGYPEKMNEAVMLMESLQVHAKKVMWTPYDDINTCGPVWDYEWD